MRLVRRKKGRGGLNREGRKEFRRFVVSCGGTDDDSEAFLVPMLALFRAYRRGLGEVRGYFHGGHVELR